MKGRRVHSGNILITSASRKIPLIRAAQAAGCKVHPAIRVVAGDYDETALARYVADDFWKMPRTTEAELGAMLAGCRARKIDTIFPTRDGELMFWARAKDRFAQEGITVVVSEPASVNRCLDKLEFARFGEAQDLPVIPARLHPDDVGAGPYVVKERYGAGSRKIGLNLDRASALAHGAKLDEPIYQPFVAGVEISIDAWLDRHGLPRGVVLRRRDRVVDGESQVTTTFRDDRLEAAAVSVLRALALRGPVVMQAIVGADGTAQIIECNARFGGASTTAIAAGLDMLYWSLLEARDPDPSNAPFLRSAREVRQIRVPSDIIVHDPDL